MKQNKLTFSGPRMALVIILFLVTPLTIIFQNCSGTIIDNPVRSVPAKLKFKSYPAQPIAMGNTIEKIKMCVSTVQLYRAGYSDNRDPNLIEQVSLTRLADVSPAGQIISGIELPTGLYESVKIIIAPAATVNGDCEPGESLKLKSNVGEFATVNDGIFVKNDQSFEVVANSEVEVSLVQLATAIAPVSGSTPLVTTLDSAGFIFTSSNANARVNWVDPLGYTKPAYVPINKPDETNVLIPKYWVDLSSGSGSSCSQSNPCGSFSNVVGKPGTQGGPAIIYVKGEGGINWYNANIHGSGDADCRTSSCDNWILIRTWPAGSPGCTTECTATIEGGSNINSSNAHHIMWDGGPDLKIRFRSDGNPYQFAMILNSDWHIVYRTQMFCAASGVYGFGVGSYTVSDHNYFINNEFHSCAANGEAVSSVSWGVAAGGGYTSGVMQNNIIRNMSGGGIYVGPSVTSDSIQIIGNALHDNGMGACSNPTRCRPDIVLYVQGGGGNNNTLIANNLMWNAAAGCIGNNGGGSPAAIIANNTCYNYNRYATVNSNNPTPEGINGGDSASIVENNIIFSDNGTDPFDQSYTASNNACGSGKSCGSASQVWTNSHFLSTSTASADFLKLNSTSVARDTGVPNVNVTIDYLKQLRPQGSAYDIGAIEY